MSTHFDLFQILLDHALEDDRIDYLLKHAVSGKEFHRSVGFDGAAQRRARNNALIRASGYLMPGECDAFERAKALSKAVVRFRNYLWPRIMKGAQLELSPHEICLKRAFLADKDVPSSAYHLCKLIK